MKAGGPADPRPRARKALHRRELPLRRHPLVSGTAQAAWLASAPVALAHTEPTHADSSQARSPAPCQAADPTRVDHTVTLALSDQMHFEPGRITVQRGDSVRFVLAGHGRLVH